MDMRTYSILMRKIREAGGDISGLTAEVEDLEERVQQLANALVNLGVTTTPLTDGVTTNPIVINGESVTAPNNGFVAYGSKEYLFNGTIWREFGDVSDFYTKTESDNKYVAKETGKGLSTEDYTTAEKNKLATMSDASVNSITNAGTLASLVYDAETESYTFTTGVLPTYTAVSVVTSAANS